MADLPVIESYNIGSTNDSPGTTYVLEPSGISSGDLLVICYAVESANTNSNPTISGWTLINASDNSQDVQCAIYWKIATGGESWPLAITPTSGEDYGVAVIFRISGHDPSTPIHKTGSWDGLGTTDSELSVTEVTTTVDNCLGIAMCGYDGNDVCPASVSGTGWSLFESVEQPSDPSGFGVGIDVATKSITSAGGSVDCLFTMTGTDGRLGIQIAIAPSGGVPTGMIIGGVSAAKVGSITYSAVGGIT